MTVLVQYSICLSFSANLLSNSSSVHLLLHKFECHLHVLYSTGNLTEYRIDIVGMALCDFVSAGRLALGIQLTNLKNKLSGRAAVESLSFGN